MYKTIFQTALLFVAFVVLQSGGCNNVKELEYRGISKTTLQTLNLSNAELLIGLDYFNPNNFGLDIKETNLSVYLNDKFIALADQPSKTQIPKSALFTFPVVARFDPIKVLGFAFANIFSKKVKLTLQGSAKIGKQGVYLKVPLNITENIDISL
ncbi:MAG: LEA type 2 family protein [Chitinophagaceae bacterium]|nr:LEA type 2 family protein [Chitinophagaceae bacterium]